MSQLRAVGLAAATLLLIGAAGPFGVGVQTSGPVQRPGSIPEPLVRLARDARSRPLGERVEAISGALLGAPYLLDGLGEGAGRDADPLARYDGFDCQTFVEEVLALSLALDPLDAGRVRRSLRYGDKSVTFAHRRHFTELQWLPGLIADGWLVDSTATYGEVRPLRQEVDAAFWRGWRDRVRFSEIPDDELPMGEQRLDILPIAAAIRAAPTVAAGSVVLIVREPKPGNPIWTTHMGVAVGDGKLRHASLTSKRVKEQPLAEYLSDAAEWRGWPVAGIAIYTPIDVSP